MKRTRATLVSVRWRTMLAAVSFAACTRIAYCGSVEWIDRLSKESFSGILDVEQKCYDVTEDNTDSQKPFLSRTSEIRLDGKRVYERSLVNGGATELPAEYVFAFNGEYSMFYNPQKNIAFQSNEPPKEEHVFVQMLSGSRARGGVLLTRERSVLFPLRHTFPPKSEAEVRVDNETKWIRFPSQNVGFDGYVEMNAKGLAVDVGAPLWQIVDNKQRIAARCTVAGKPIQVRSNSGEVVSLPSSIVLDIYENTGPDKRRHLQHITTITNVDQNAPLTEGQFRVSLQSGTVIRNKLLGTTFSDVSDDTLLIDLLERNLSLLETAPSAQNRNSGERGTAAGTPTPREETHSARSETDEDRQSTSTVVRETGREKENVDYGYVYLLAAIFAALGAFLAYYLYHKIQGRRMAYQKLK